MFFWVNVVRSKRWKRTRHSDDRRSRTRRRIRGDSVQPAAAVGRLPAAGEELCLRASAAPAQRQGNIEALCARGTRPAPRPAPRGDAGFHRGVRGVHCPDEGRAQRGIFARHGGGEKQRNAAAVCWGRAATGRPVREERGRNLVSSWEGLE